jgi:hypothetical protein
MPYKDPEHKRQWEREHRQQRNAKRRTQRLNVLTPTLVWFHSRGRTRITFEIAKEKGFDPLPILFGTTKTQEGVPERGLHRNGQPAPVLH